MSLSNGSESFWMLNYEMNERHLAKLREAAQFFEDSEKSKNYPRIFQRKIISSWSNPGA